jgi:Tol biopolymer transport system component
MDTSGQQPLRLNHDTIEDRYPKCSADGVMISWTKVLREKLEVWCMNKKGRDQRKLADGFYPTWSPDSRTIVFSNFNPSGDKIVLWRVRLDGTNVRQLTH